MKTKLQRIAHLLLVLVAAFSIFTGGLLLNAHPSYAWEYDSYHDPDNFDRNPDRTVQRASQRGADLRGFIMEDLYWENEDLSGANLSGARLRKARLSGANLSGANLADSYLSGADLSYANLNRANLSGANLSDANLRGAQLNKANLKGANLRGLTRPVLT